MWFLVSEWCFLGTAVFPRIRFVFGGLRVLDGFRVAFSKIRERFIDSEWYFSGPQWRFIEFRVVFSRLRVMFIYSEWYFIDSGWWFLG